MNAAAEGKLFYPLSYEGCLRQLSYYRRRKYCRCGRWKLLRGRGDPGSDQGIDMQDGVGRQSFGAQAFLQRIESEFLGRSDAELDHRWQ